MIRKEYNTMILSRIEQSFDRIMPIGSVVAFVSALAIYFSNVPKKFVIFDFVVGLIFLVLAVLKHRFSAQHKIYITIWVTISIGVLSFMDGGFFSAGIQLIMISNIMAVMLVSQRKSAIIAVISTLIFVSLYIYYLWMSPVGILEMETMLWLIQFLVFVLYLFILHTVVYSIRDYLLENIEELEDSMEETYALAYYDILTGLPNQNKFREDLDQHVSPYMTGYMVVLNVRNLDMINSIYNDRIGDEVLKNIGYYLDVNKQDNEYVARVSGNEFAIWVDCDNFVEFRTRMLKEKYKFFEQFKVAHMTKTVTFNASYMKHLRGTPVAETYRKVNLALTYAKSQGEPTVTPYNEELEAIIREDELIKERLELALENRSFSVNYQGKYDTTTKQLVGVEALARLEDAYGKISPNTFIPKLEEMNAAVTFGERMIRQVFADYLAICSKYKRELSVAINISPSQLMSEGFIDYIRHEIIKYEILPSQVVLEITEDVMIENITIVKTRIEHLKNIGFKIALDDFGSGYSSLSYLTLFQFDEVKIDKSFIDQIELNNKVDKMIELIVTLSRELNLNVVAEGVETSEQFEKLVEIGCHEVQGFFFSRPEAL